MTVIYLDKKLIGIGVLAAIVTFIVGLLVGHFGIQKSNGTPGSGSSRNILVNEFIRETIEDVDGMQIRSFLQELARIPHIAASERDRELTKWISQEWKNYGFENVQLDSYNILLSYPNQTTPNKIYLKDADGKIHFTSKHKEDVLRREDEHPNFIHAFNGFSPPGNVTGDLVFVNRGSIDDIKKLKDLKVDLTGKIAIARYGKLFRGNKLRNVEDAGAVGLILYSDPGDVAPYGTDPEDVYPNTMFMPPSAVQRGAVLVVSDGELLSPGWPAVDDAYRISINETDKLPKIPSQPIGYGDAEQLLSIMGGQDVPEEWRGGIPGLDYKLGPGFDESHQGWKTNLVVNNYLRDTESDNIIGVIEGAVEPDRYVIIGNHRDAWGYGAVDPSSGTAVIMEIARVLGEKMKTGWRPRRTIIIASWTSEEAGLFGSREWVHDKIHKLSSRTVTYLNLDICASGDILSAAASPLMRGVFFNSLKDIKHSHEDQSYYDFLQQYLKTSDPPKNITDAIGILGSGSDMDAFAFFAGVPSTSFIFNVDKKKYPKVGFYPAYHTGYETFYLVDEIIDPGFRIARACAQIELHMALQMAESTLLPYSLTEIPRNIDKAFKKLTDGAFKKLRDEGLGKSIDVLINAVDNFKDSIYKFNDKIQKEIPGNIMRQRMFNDKMMLLEKIFLLPSGLPGRPSYKHALFSPAKFNLYAGAVFPGVEDLMHDFDDIDTSEKPERIKEFQRHLSDLMIMFRQATRWLSDVEI